MEQDIPSGTAQGSDKGNTEVKSESPNNTARAFDCGPDPGRVAAGDRAETDLAPPLEVHAAGRGGPWQGGRSGWRLRAHGSCGGLTAPLAVPVARASGLALRVRESAWMACGRGVRAGNES